ncbi:MAG: glycerophosphodiester phosphodiesterase [Pontixanthobacter sp.]
MGKCVLLKWLLLGLMVALPTLSQARANDRDMLIIAHRGASGERPEHTLAAYERAIDQGADYIEPDLVVTKDGVLVARHENELSGTTDVASREEFEDRNRTKTIDGQKIAGWFAEDFTLAELRTLRAVERIPNLRPANARFDGLYPVPTFAEIVALVRAKEAETGRRVGLYPELKHPEFLLQEEGIDMVDLLLAELRAVNLTAADPVFIQSFEVGPLQRLNQRSDFKLVQLIAENGGPADEPEMRYAEMIASSGLAEIATYADGIGVAIPLILTGFTERAHEAGLAVHAWTVRKENVFLPAAMRSSSAEAAIGDDAALIALLREAGVDGIFTDDPARAVEALK